MNTISGIQHGQQSSFSGMEVKEENKEENKKEGKLKALSGHGYNELPKILSSNDTPESLGISLNKRNLDNAQIAKSLVTGQSTDNNNNVTGGSVQEITTAVKHQQYHQTDPSKEVRFFYNQTLADYPFSRIALTDAQREILEKLDNQQHCYARWTKIGGEDNQLRPVILLSNGVPISFHKSKTYITSDVIAITLDTGHHPSQASYKKDARSNDLTDASVPLKNLSKLQWHIASKLQEHSERINQPIYSIATSGKLMVESDEVCFTKIKRPRMCFTHQSELSNNETLIPPFKPCDVQSILVPIFDFMFNLDQVLINKSVYEKRHGLMDLPITIYDLKTGERIHCFESQLFQPRQKNRYFEKLKVLKHLLEVFGVKAEKFQAFQGASPKFFIDFVLNLSSDFLQYNYKHQEEILKLFDNPENKIDLKILCQLISDGADLNFTVKYGNIRIPFLSHVIQQLGNSEKIGTELIKNHQQLIYILIHHPQAKSQFLRDPEYFILIPEYLRNIFFIGMPEYANHCALEIQFIIDCERWYLKHPILALYCAGYVYDNMNDLLCKKIIRKFVFHCIWPRILNREQTLTVKTCLSILLHWKTLNDLKPEILNVFKEQLEFMRISQLLELYEKWNTMDVDLTPILSLTRGSRVEVRNEILDQVAKRLYRHHMNYWSNFLQSDEFEDFPETVKWANNNLPTLPDHLKEITLPTSPTVELDNRPLLESLKQPFAQPLTIPDTNDSHQATRAILDRYYRTLGPNRVVDIQNLERPARSTLHGCGHALRVSTNIRLLMQLLEMYDLAELSQQQKQLLEYAAVYHDAAAEDVEKDREEIASAEYFRRDMIHNCPAIDQDDILAIAEAMEHKEDDIRNEENAAINQQQRLYRRLLRFADRLDIARCLLIPEDFPNFEQETIAGKTAGELDARLLDIDAEWLNHEKFRNALVSCIHGLLDLAAVSGGAIQDQRTAKKGYIKNYQLNPKTSERLNQFFEKTPEPLKALEDLIDDNVRRYIAQRAGLTTCGDPEHRQCDQQHEHNHEGVSFGYTRYIHNRYHDLAQVGIPQMQLWEKLAVNHAPELLPQALQLVINDEVKRLGEVGIKRNIGSPSQETLVHPEAQQFLKKHHGLAVIAEDKLREVIPATVGHDRVRHRHENILILKDCRKRPMPCSTEHL